MIVYLHGFRSSPSSFKARMLAEQLARRGCASLWRCPALPPSPAAAVSLVSGLIEQADDPRRCVLIGSSLGGYYATVLAERHGCACVLLNPAVEPQRDLAPMVGRQSAYHAPDDPDQCFDFKSAYLDELRGMRPVSITNPERYLLFAAKGDEVLDYREMLARYAGCPTRLIEGSDHGLSDFDAHIDAVLSYCLQAAGASAAEPPRA
jgi:predicted esterase YcpF (UPF0227 family)